MGSARFDQVVDDIKRAIANGRNRKLPIDAQVVPALGVINRLLGAGGATVSRSKLTIGDDEATVTGNIMVDTHSTTALLTVADGTPLAVVLRAEFDDDISLVHAISSFGGPIGTLASRFLGATGAAAQNADIVISNAAISASSLGELVTISGTTTAPVGLRLADRELTLHLDIDLASALSADGSGARNVALVARGTISIGPAEVAVGVSISSDARTLQGSWSAGEVEERIQLVDVFSSMGLPVPELPDELMLDLTHIGFSWESASRTLTVAAEADGFGALTIVATKSEAGTWGQTITFEMEEGTSAADLPIVGSEMGDLDTFTIEKLAIVYASEPGSVAADMPPGSAPALQRGINAVAVLDLYEGDDHLPAGSASGQLSELVGARRLAVAVSAATGAGVTVQAELDGMVDIGGGLALGNAWARLTTAPFGVSLGGTLRADLGEQILVADGTITIDVTQSNGSLLARTETRLGEPANMLEPLGIRGVSLSAIGLGLGVVYAPPSMTFGMQAKFGLGSDQPADANEFVIALQVIPAAPAPIVNVLVAQFALAELSIGRMLGIFVDDAPALPQVISDIEARDLGFHYAQRPTPLPDGTIAEPGFGFHGEVDLFGLRARAAVMIDANSGARGRFEMAPVDLRLGELSILRITSATSLLSELGGSTPALTAGPTAIGSPNYAGGPVFEFDSKGPRYLYANCEIELFGLFRTAVLAEITNDGLTYIVQQAISDVLTITMGCTVSTGPSPRLRARAAFDLDLDIEIPVIVGGLDLGTIDLDTALHLLMEIDASPDAFLLTIDGDFEFEGVEFDFPRLTLTVPLASFTGLAQQIIDHLVDQAGTLFEDLFADLEQLWNDTTALIEQGAAAIAEAAAEILEEADEVATAIVEGAEAAVEAVAEVGRAAEELAQEAAVAFEEGLEAVAQVSVEVEEFAADVGREIEAVGEQAVAFVDDVAEDTEQFVADVGREIVAIADDVDRAVADTVKEAEKVAAEVIAAAEKVVAAIAADTERIVADLEKEISRIAADVEQVLADIARFAEEAALATAAALAAAANEIAGAAETVANDVVATGEAVGNEIVSWFKW